MRNRALKRLDLRGVRKVPSYAESASNWLQIGRDAAHTGANPVETSISAATASQLSLRWARSTSGWVRSSPAVVDNVVYAASEDGDVFAGDVFAVDARTGSDRWSRHFDVLIESSPTVSNGRVFIGMGVDAEPASLVALDAKTGQTIWTASLTYAVNFSSPTVADGIVYIGSKDTGSSHGILWARDEATGAELWSKDFGTGILGSPAVANGIVYVDNAKGVFALDSRRAERWVYRSGDNGSPSVVDGTLYFGSSGLIALNAATGQYKWRHDPIGGYIDLSSPAVANGTVYIGATDGNVYAINADTGALRWTYEQTRSPIESSPAVANGVVFIGSYNGRLYALDASSGVRLWSSPALPDSLIESSPAVSNGSVYVGSSDGHLDPYSPSGPPSRQLSTSVAAGDSDSGWPGVGATRTGDLTKSGGSSRASTGPHRSMAPQP